MSPQKPVVVVGGGISGLAAANALGAITDCPIVVLEQRPSLGGLAGSFSVDKARYPLTYHHISASDRLLCGFLDELGIPFRLRKLGVGTMLRGRFHPLHGPRDILAWSDLPLSLRLRMLAAGARSLLVRDPARLNELTCRAWFGPILGDRGFDRLFAPLLWAKFGRESESISAEWLVRRLKFRESSGLFGYPQGGFDAITSALQERILAAGNRIHLGAVAERIQLSRGDEPRVAAVHYRDQQSGGELSIEPSAVLSTLPAPALLQVSDPLPPPLAQALGSCEYSACITGILGFNQQLGDQYCTTLPGPTPLTPAVFDHSRLAADQPKQGSVLYLSAYLRPEAPPWQRDDAWFVERFLAAAAQVYPQCPPRLRWTRVTRLSHAKLVYYAGYRSTRPRIHTPLPNLFLAGSSLYPPLRNIGYAVDLARQAARATGDFLSR